MLWITWNFYGIGEFCSFGKFLPVPMKITYACTLTFYFLKKVNDSALAFYVTLSICLYYLMCSSSKRDKCGLDLDHIQVLGILYLNYKNFAEMTWIFKPESLARKRWWKIKKKFCCCQIKIRSPEVCLRPYLFGPILWWHKISDHIYIVCFPLSQFTKITWEGEAFFFLNLATES